MHSSATRRKTRMHLYARWQRRSGQHACELRRCSPTLADRVAARSEAGVEQVAKELIAVLKDAE